jgi:NAD(P)H-dependent FMN reductase
MTRIGVILGSTRPGRNGEQVARWVMDIAARREDADFELIDLADFPLPHLDEPLHRRWVSTRIPTLGSGRRPSDSTTDSSW